MATNPRHLMSLEIRSKWPPAKSTFLWCISDVYLLSQNEKIIPSFTTVCQVDGRWDKAMAQCISGGYTPDEDGRKYLMKVLEFA
ncbi:hypothetical protein FKM82_028140 [Ascaphus truei]